MLKIVVRPFLYTLLATSLYIAAALLVSHLGDARQDPMTTQSIKQ